MNAISLFSGIGGIDLAAHYAGFNAVVPQVVYPVLKAIYQVLKESETL